MQTPFDFLTVAVFAGLAVLFLHRSVAADQARDKMWMYAPPALGCVFANWVGNIGWQNGDMRYDVLAGFTLVAVVAYIFHILKPFAKNA
jgi:hypothetical protein